MRTAILDLIDWFQGDFSSTDWGAFLLPIKIISACLSIGLLIIVIYLIYLIRRDIKKFFELAVDVVEEAQPEKVSIEGWQLVLDKLDSHNEDSYKQAVIEADKIFDDLLKRSNYQGEDMGGRLKQIDSEQLANIDEVWQAHKLRNRLVHETDFKLKEHEAKRVIEIYEKALQDLEAL